MQVKEEKKGLSSSSKLALKCAMTETTFLIDRFMVIWYFIALALKMEESYLIVGKSKDPVLGYFLGVANIFLLKLCQFFVVHSSFFMLFPMDNFQI